MRLTASAPAIAMRDNPSDPYGKVLVLTGENPDQILIAARALTLGRFQRDTDEAAALSDVLPPPRSLYDAPKWLQAGTSVRIAENAAPGLLKAGTGNQAKLYFRLAPDLYFGSHASVPLKLGYRLSNVPAGARAQIRITLNGVFVAHRELQIHSSPELQSQSFGIPSVLLYPSNTLTVGSQNSVRQSHRTTVSPS